MPKLFADLDPGDVILIPAGSGASVQFVQKSGKRQRVQVTCDQPVTISKANATTTAPSPRVLARKPVPQAAGIP